MDHHDDDGMRATRATDACATKVPALMCVCEARVPCVWDFSQYYMSYHDKVIIKHTHTHKVNRSSVVVVANCVCVCARLLYGNLWLQCGLEKARLCCILVVDGEVIFCVREMNWQIF